MTLQVLILSSVAFLLWAYIAGITVNDSTPTRSCCLLTWSTFPSCDCNYRSAFRCCVVVIYGSRLPLPLPLSDRVPVVVAAMLAYPRSHLTIVITSQSSAAVLLSVCYDCHCHCHCWIAFLLLWCSCCTWKEGSHGDKDVDNERANIVIDDKGLLMSETNKDNNELDCKCN